MKRFRPPVRVVKVKTSSVLHLLPDKFLTTKTTESQPTSKTNPPSFKHPCKLAPKATDEPLHLFLFIAFLH